MGACPAACARLRARGPRESEGRRDPGRAHSAHRCCVGRVHHPVGRDSRAAWAARPANCRACAGLQIVASWGPPCCPAAGARGLQDVSKDNRDDIRIYSADIVARLQEAAPSQDTPFDVAVAGWVGGLLLAALHSRTPCSSQAHQPRRPSWLVPPSRCPRRYEHLAPSVMPWQLANASKRLHMRCSTSRIAEDFGLEAGDKVRPAARGPAPAHPDGWDRRRFGSPGLCCARLHPCHAWHPCHACTRARLHPHAQPAQGQDAPRDCVARPQAAFFTTGVKGRLLLRVQWRDCEVCHCACLPGGLQLQSGEDPKPVSARRCRGGGGVWRGCSSRNG